MSSKEKLVNVDVSGSAHFGIYIDPAGDSPIFDVTQEDLERARKAIKAPDIDTVISMMGIVEPPFTTRLKLKDGGGDSNHATTRL